ncbi:MAG: hypothetical protein ACTSW1_17100 [Candidatus Hodarchaeales archaeon]
MDKKLSKDYYKKFAAKLAKIQESAKIEAEETLSDGLEKLSTTSYLPNDLSSYLLSLKNKLSLPISTLPASFFKKPLFKGKEDFFSRLSSEIISFGLSYQRVYLKPIRLFELAHLFHIHRSWWKCDIQDIENAVSVLLKENIVIKTDEGLLFEPLNLSQEVQEFLSLSYQYINEFGELPIRKIKEISNWQEDKIDSLIALLVKNRICILDKDRNLIYFPEFSKEDS